MLALNRVAQCQHVAFIPRQPVYFGPAERYDWERLHSRDTQKDKFCHHTLKFEVVVK